MTVTAETIVIALEEGPASARDLSQRLRGIGYANIRQTLGRLARAGRIQKLRRGVYALRGATSGTPDERNDAATEPSSSDQRRVRLAILEVWAEFDALNDPSDPRAWQ